MGNIINFKRKIHVELIIFFDLKSILFDLNQNFIMCHIKMLKLKLITNIIKNR